MNYFKAIVSGILAPFYGLAAGHGVWSWWGATTLPSYLAAGITALIFYLVVTFSMLSILLDQWLDDEDENRQEWFEAEVEFK